VIFRWRTMVVGTIILTLATRATARQRHRRH
jgi:hypothetical protein